MDLLGQFERFAIPKVRSVEMLGTYAVLAAVVGSPFRMIQIAINFSLLPRLRAVASAAETRAIIVSESLTALLMAIASMWSRCWWRPWCLIPC